jgi:hypothetical protein
MCVSHMVHSILLKLTGLHSTVLVLKSVCIISVVDRMLFMRNADDTSIMALGEVGRY